MATSSTLYSEQMKGLFGFATAGPNSPVRNIRLTRESIEKMEEDQLNATHDQLDVQEEQLKVLKKIAKHAADGKGTGGSMLDSLLGGYLGFKGIKGISTGAGKLKGLVGNIFKAGTSKVLAWSKTVTGGVIGALASSRVAVRNLRLGMATKVRAAVAMLSGTILSSVTGLLNGIGSIIKSGARSAAKLIAKIAAPITAAWAAYDGYAAYKKAGEIDKGKKLSTTDKAAVGIAGATDSLLFGVPSSIQQQMTGEDLVTSMTKRSIIEKRLRDNKLKQIKQANDAYYKQQKDLADKGVWEGFWPEFKQAVGIGGDTAAGYDPSVSRNLANKRRNMATPFTGTMLEPISNKVDISSAVAVGAKAAATITADKVSPIASPLANNRTYGYFETITSLLGGQSETLKNLYKVADEQLDKAKNALRNTTGFTGDFWDSMFKSYDDTAIGDQAGNFKGGIDPKINGGASGDGVGSSAVSSVVPSNQLFATPKITSSEAANRELQTFAVNDNKKVITAGGPAAFGSLGATGTGAGSTYKSVTSVSKGIGGSALSGKGATENAQDWFGFFTKPKDQGGMGYSTNQAMGMVATMQGESGTNLDPTIVNKNDRGKPAYGTAQWRGSRAEGLKAMAAKMGLPWQDKRVQQAWYKHETENDPLYKKFDTSLRGTTTAEEAVGVGVQKFERPQHAGLETNKRIGNLEHLRTVDNKNANVNPRLLQSNLSGDMSISLPKYGGAAGANVSSIVKQAQGVEAGTRKKDITDSLQTAMAEQVLKTFGPGYSAKVYSGGQGYKGSGEPRVGTTRHDGGKAGDAYIYDPNGNMISQTDYARFAQGWLAEKKGGIGLQMSGGGMRVDEHKDRAPFWDYDGKGGKRLTAATRDIIKRGLAGEQPEYNMTAEEARAYLAKNGESGKELATNVVSLQDQSLKARSKGASGLGRLLSNDKYAARYGNTEKKDTLFDSSFRPSGMDGYTNNGAVASLTTGQEQLLRQQGTEIAKGMVEAERITPKPLSFNPQLQSNAIFNAVDSAPIKGSKVSENPTGSSTSNTQLTPRDIPHTDELTMLMANSQMTDNTMPTVFDASKADEENYKILISCPGHGIDIIADMPEQITVGTQSDWESLMNYSLAGALDAAIGGTGKVIAGALATAGGKAFNAQLKPLSFQVWMGTTPLEFPLQIQFNAKTSAMNDVYKPMGYLGAMVLPINQGGGILFPPGPSIGGALNGYGVHIRLGRLTLFKDCIITACNLTYDSRLDKDGIPISGEAEITFRTSTVYGHKDFLNALQLEIT